MKNPIKVNKKNPLTLEWGVITHRLNMSMNAYRMAREASNGIIASYLRPVKGRNQSKFFDNRFTPVYKFLGDVKSKTGRKKRVQVIPANKETREKRKVITHYLDVNKK